MVRFGEVVRDVNEAERNPLDAGLERFVGLEHIEPENLHLKQWGNLADGDISFTKRFRKGQVLFGKRRAYQRKVAIAEFDGICSSDILTFEPKGDDLLPELLPFVVQSEGFFEHALGTSSGSLSPRTRWKQLQDYEFPLAPKDEQRRISDILWAADELIEWRTTVDNALSQLKQVMLSATLHGTIGHANVSQFTLTQIPPGWGIATIGEICRVIRGSSPRPKGDPRYYGGHVPRVMVADITRDGKYVTPCLDFLTEEGAKKSRPVPAGTFVLVCSGTKEAVGSPGLLAIDACIHDGIIGLVEVTDRCRPLWLFYLFAFFQTFLDSAATHGGTFVNLTTDIVRGIQLALPPIDFQDAFVAQMDQIDASIKDNERQRSTDRALAKAVFKHFLTLANVQDADSVLCNQHR